MLNHKGTQEIVTERLLLRKYKMSDAENMFKNYANDEPSTYNWAIEYEGEIIGGISAMFVDDMRRNCEAGYCIGYDFWNKGITSEALSAIINYLFNEVGMHRIMAKHDVENPASGEVMKKCGMTFEGRMKEYYIRYD